MKTDITTSSWEDVVFESRNKEYGAYAIRKSYDENVTKASLVALLFAAFIFGSIQIASLLHVDIKEKVVIPNKDGFTIPPIILRNQVAKRQSPPDHHINRNLLERIVTQEVIQAQPTEITTVAPEGTESGAGAVETEVGIDPGPGTESVQVAEELPHIFDNAEIMPMYEGGTAAMIRFISRNTHYPGSAKRMGQEGTVYVRFVVNSLGQVVDVEVLKGVSGVLDREAIRVISLMNRWKPGMQHNLPVNVRMVLPIKFMLEQ